MQARGGSAVSSLGGWPFVRLAGRGYVDQTHADPSTSPLRKSVLRLLAPVVGGLGSIAGVHTSEQVAALTFDDGPDALVTPAILDVLKAREARATFFVLVDRAESEPALVQRMVDEGHEIGLHGLDHTRLTTLTVAEARRRTLEGRARLERLSGRKVSLFRPAFGAQGLASYATARRAGMQVVIWNASALDWLEQAADDVADTVYRVTHPGSIILMHDGYESVPGAAAPTFDKAKALASAIVRLQSDGYRMTTVSGLLKRGPAVRVLWFGR